ncbi:glutathione S-transferase family protein [Parvularcula sp. ZS-1/3]|uniref:Glutathione S-transferase family protein n=1 Tax=Parvularcula mediterranea TaxID=2732508 RepID=A0A7Y3W6R7_9PROT|nr:glutathione S-transferase family protein [Parvularcula mediterranea]NNU17647.1 glutathione S-transferase family protein [Parvularcula mediterranea]
MTIKIFHAPFARSVRARWLCLEMGLDHEIVQVPNKPEYLSSDEYRAINPAGKIPAMQENGLILFESTAIMQYLLTKPGGEKFAPQADDPLYGPYLQWLHFGEAGMGMYVTLALGHKTLLPEERRIPAMAKYGEIESKRCFDVLAGPLEANDYLLPTGFSAADISVAYMLLLAKFAKIFDHAPDSVKAYFKRCTEREAWKQATAD